MSILENNHRQKRAVSDHRDRGCLPLLLSKSFPLLAYQIYYGARVFPALRAALDTGLAQRDGLARSVEYLGLDNELRRSRRGRGRETRRKHVGKSLFESLFGCSWPRIAYRVNGGPCLKRDSEGRPWYARAPTRSRH